MIPLVTGQPSKRRPGKGNRGGKQVSSVVPRARDKRQAEGHKETFCVIQMSCILIVVLLNTLKLVNFTFYALYPQNLIFKMGCMADLLATGGFAGEVKTVRRPGRGEPQVRAEKGLRVPASQGQARRPGPGRPGAYPRAPPGGRPDLDSQVRGA